LHILFFSALNMKDAALITSTPIPRVAVDKYDPLQGWVLTDSEDVLVPDVWEMRVNVWSLVSCSAPDGPGRMVSRPAVPPESSDRRNARSTYS
jgi:hypothetical protein